MLPNLSGILHEVFTSPLTLVTLGLVLLIFGVIATLLFGSYFRADLHSRTWPSVPGKVLSDRVQRYQNFDRDSHNYYTVYKPNVQYTYEVAGAAYTGNKVANRVFYSRNRTTFDSLKKRYPAGAGVKVYYDPNNPAQAILEPVSRSNLPYLVFGIALDAAGLVLLGLCLYRLIF